MKKILFSMVTILIVGCAATPAQTPEFTYQGRLLDGSLPASGTYEMRFRLFDAESAGTQQPQPAPITLDFTVTGGNPVTVANGVFTVKLDFTASAFPGAARFLEIGVRKTTDPPGFTMLTPRQPVTSGPQAVRSLTSSSADGLSVSCVLCVTDAQIQSIDGSKVTGTVTNAINAAQASFATSAGFANVAANANRADALTGVCNQCVTNGHIQSLDGGKLTGVILGDGSGLTNLNGGNIAAGSINTTQISPDALPNSTNLKLLGSLRWDLLKGQGIFSVGDGPVELAFDGSNMWVANFNSGSITKLRASNGANLGTFPVGTNPRAIAFDGTNIWVANFGSSNITKLRAGDGVVLGTFATGTSPHAVAFDGANIWVANSGSNNVTKLRAGDGENLGTFAAGLSPRGIAFDGANIWVTNHLSSNATKLRASDGTTIGTYPTGSSPLGIAFDGINMWIVNFFGFPLPATGTKLRASDGANAGNFEAGPNPVQIAFDGANFWVTNVNSVTTSVRKLRANDSANLGIFQVGTQLNGIAFDGANMWVTNIAAGSVTRLPPAFPQ